MKKLRPVFFLYLQKYTLKIKSHLKVPIINSCIVQRVSPPKVRKKKAINMSRWRLIVFTSRCMCFEHFVVHAISHFK